MRPTSGPVMSPTFEPVGHDAHSILSHKFYADPRLRLKTSEQVLGPRYIYVHKIQSWGLHQTKLTIPSIFALLHCLLRVKVLQLGLHKAFKRPALHSFNTWPQEVDIYVLCCKGQFSSITFNLMKLLVPWYQQRY